MTTDQTTDMVLAIIAFGALGLGLLSMLIGWVVKTYDRLRGRAMSSAGDLAPQSSPPSQDQRETDARQTTPAPALPKRRAEEFLTLCRLMRAAGIKREAAQAAFMASDLPFNNNVWARAEPPPAAHVTPYAGRATDADFPYQPLEN